MGSYIFVYLIGISASLFGGYGIVLYIISLKLSSCVDAWLYEPPGNVMCVPLSLVDCYQIINWY